jgi:ketosteroid isomerase-like protein
MNRDRIAQNLAAVENHFHSEALNEVEAALETFTDDILWEAPALNGLNRSFSGKEATAKNYRELFASMRNVKFEFLQRFANDDRVVDDSIVTFEVAKDGYWHFPVGSKIEMRLVHIFEMRDGNARRENFTGACLRYGTPRVSYAQPLPAKIPMLDPVLLVECGLPV